MFTPQSPDWRQNIDTDPLFLAFQSIKETVKQSKDWASRSLRDCLEVRGMADEFVEQSSEYWLGPNADEFRRIASRYLEGPLATNPRRTRRSLPIGIYTGLFTSAHLFFSRLLTEIEESDYERVLPKLCNQMEDARSDLAALSISTSDTVLDQNVESRRTKQLQIEALERRMRELAAELAIAWDCCDHWISLILGKIADFRNDLNRIGPYLTAHSDLSLPTSSVSIGSLISSGLQIDDFAAGVKTQISRADVEISADHPWFKWAEQLVVENPDLWGLGVQRTLQGTIVLRGAGGALNVALAAVDLGVSGIKLENEADVLCFSLKNVLGFPKGVFEKYFEPLIRKQFRSTLFSKGLFNCFQAGVAFLGPGGLVAALALEVIDQKLLTNVLENALDDSIDQVLNQGLSDWSRDEKTGKWVYPVEGIRRSLSG